MPWFTKKKKSPFRDQPKTIFHGAYHKMGTTWLANILRGLAQEFGLSVQISNQNGETHDGSDILIANHSQTDLSVWNGFVGSHMIRDPRDAIVSGYHYHLWTNEAWARTPSSEFDGNSYQQHLNELSQSDGITAEIRRFGTYIEHYRLLEWNYEHSGILELKYESLITNETEEFTRLFQHYGFHDDAIAIALQVAEKYSFRNIANRSVGQEQAKSHLRSGKSNQWQALFNAEQIKLVKELAGDLLIRMGYESDLDW